ncbi:hypothetical protein [Micromonospora foliorum]|uniref:hypothetical protein n=1 Tax=Micromonospora foliorum TaxID=2911210 RepID=UPI001EE847DD|nr:hypothetical protein [Micromonospora foliorum]MCG5435155.1 hypothetical protein [Micromonospora foliorum]
MRTTRPNRLALAVAAGIAMVLSIPTAASAAYWGDETDYAVSSSGPTGDYVCATHTGVTACFKPDGDVLYVKDRLEDGYAAVAIWDHVVEGNYRRSGACVNKLGADHWGQCNKDFYEAGDLQFAAARYNNGNPVDRGNWVWESIS